MKTTRERSRLAAMLTVLLSIGGCSGSTERVVDARLAPLARPIPARPESCRAIAAGSDLQKTIDAAGEGEALCLEGGEWKGPLTIERGITLWGPREAVVRSTGKGTTVLVKGHGTKLLGMTVDGSGGRFDTLDAAVKVHADDVRVEGLHVTGATFGILVERANRVALLNCEVHGNPSVPHGLRGDSIRLWETRDSAIEGNLVRDGRDVVVWYSSRNTIRRNTVEGSRYGTHFMYSHQNEVEDNRFLGNVVGVFVMYSRDLSIARNVMADASGAAGIGLGIKESGNLTVTDNLFVHDTVGVYLDTSPLQLDDSNTFRRNAFRLGGTGVVFHSSPSRNAFYDNTFADNRVPVTVEGGGDALGALFSGNDFDDYAGFDLDGDGIGDLPYELRLLSSQLTGRRPELAFFQGTLALQLVDAVGRAVPLLAPKTIVRDLRPRVGRSATEVARAD